MQDRVQWHDLAMTEAQPPDDTTLPTTARTAPPATIMLEAVAAEIEAFVGEAGWDAGPTLFALVPTGLLAADPAAAAVLGDGLNDAAEISPDAITPIAQGELPEGPLDEALAQIGWPDEVIGCALSQEIVMLPPSAEPELDDLSIESAATVAADHPERREARLVVAVLRDGRTAGILRLRGTADAGDDLLTGPDLAPNLLAALVATLAD
jgi:hypothetical protein